MAPSLVAIHANGLAATDFRILAKNRVGLVWSPLSNLLLYGGTADVAAAHAAGVPLGARFRLVAERQPQPARRAQGRADRQCGRCHRLRSGTVTSVAMATRVPATTLGWDGAIGTVGDGKLADLVVVAGTGGTRTTTCCVPRTGTSRLSSSTAWLVSANTDLMTGIAPDAAFEAVRIGGRDRRLLLAEADVDPVIGGLTLAAARASLTDALADLASLAGRLEHPPAGAAAAALADTTPHWFLQLELDEPPGNSPSHPTCREPTAWPTAMAPPMPAATAIPPLEAARTDDPRSPVRRRRARLLGARLASQTTIRRSLYRAALAALG